METKLIFTAGLFLMTALSLHAAQPELRQHVFTGMEMAVPIKITLYAEEDSLAREAADAAFLRFRDLNARLSDYIPESELRQFCDQAHPGEFRVVSRDLWTVTREAVRYARMSDGAFDPTIGQVVRLWRQAKLRKRLPSKSEIAAALSTVGYRNILFDEERRALALAKQANTPVRIDLGGIAKGYALDEALRTIKTYGITQALVDAGGDMAAGDPPPGKDAWKIAVQPPQSGSKTDAAPSPTAIIYVANCGLAHSGDIERFVEVDGVRYSHIVDPKTGLGLTHRAAVTVIAPTAMAADALASTVSVLGQHRGLVLIETLEKTETLVLTPGGVGEILSAETSGWRRFQQTPLRENKPSD